jgi:hypothetical protein
MAPAEQRREDWPRESPAQPVTPLPAGPAGDLETIMLHYAVIFLIRSMAAVVLGFSAVA